MGGTNSEICVGRESVKRGLVQVWLVRLVELKDLSLRAKN